MALTPSVREWFFYVAKENGKVVGIGHATKEITLNILKEEIPKIHRKGYEFVFVSELLE